MLRLSLVIMKPQLSLGDIPDKTRLVSNRCRIYFKTHK